MTIIATSAELNRIALKLKVDAEYLVWCVLRVHVAEEGLSSHFAKNEAYKLALEAGLNWTRRQFNRILRAGDGLFWGIDRKNIYLRSYRRVYEAVADENAAATPSPLFVRIQVKKSALERRAELYWSWFVGRDELTISRATLAEIFGLSPDQQRSYERELGKRIVIKTNYCHIDYDLYRNQLNSIPDHYYSFIQEKFHDDIVENVHVIAYQLPNTFIASKAHSDESSLVFAPNRALKASRTLYRHTLACSYHERCFYLFYDEWEKHMNPEAYIRTFYQGKKRIWRMGQYF